MSKRSAQVGDLLREEISDVILRRVHDPRVRLASITEVDVSADLQHAVIKVSVLGSEDQRAKCLEGLRHGAGFIRSEVARRLRKMRVIPDFKFELDRGAEYSQRIEELLEHADDAD